MKTSLLWLALLCASVQGCTRPTQHLVVFDGDSLTAGLGASAGHSYPEQCAPLLGPDWKQVNLARSGQTTKQMSADASEQVDSLFVDDSASPQILVAWEITNEFLHQVSAQQAYKNFASYCQARKKKGWKVIVLTVLPRSEFGAPPDFEGKRQAANALLRKNFHFFADGLVDIALDPIIGFPKSELNKRYYGDLVHLTDEGYGIVAKCVSAEILRVASK